VPGSGSDDSARSVAPRVRTMAFCAESLPFLTRSCRNATYNGRNERVEKRMDYSGQGLFPALRVRTGRRSQSPSRPTGSPSRQRILRVSMDVHNNKDMGP